MLLLVACGDGEYGGPPALTDIGVTTAEDEPLLVVVPVSAIEADAVAFAITTPPSHGTVTGDGPTWTYTPEADYVGTDTLVVRGDDRFGSASATVRITITPVDDAPVAGADSFAGVFDTPLTIAQSTLVANDTDIDSEDLSVTTVEAAADGHGVPELSGTDVVFTPESGFEGDASFVYTVSDGELSAQGTVTVTIGVNRAPVAGEDAATTDEDTMVTIADATLLANDSDPDGQTLVITEVGNASHGIVAHVGTDVSFTPDPGYNGAAGFEYTITDGAMTDVGIVLVTVGSVNDAPVVTTTSGAAAYTENDAALALDPEIGVVDSDADPNLASATVQLTTGCADPEDVLELEVPPTGITVTGYTAATCTLALTGAAPVATYQAALRLVTYRNTSDTPSTEARVARFTVDDGQASSNTGSADRDLAVTAVDDSPVAVNDAQTVAEDASATAIAVLTNDTDVDGGSKTVASVTQPSHGTVAITGGGTGVNYTPGANYCNSPPGTSLDTFTYTLSPGSSTATVSVTVTCVNDAPVVTTSVGAAAYTENDAALALDPEIGVLDGDAISLVGATVQLTTGCADPEDVLELASPPSGITVTGYTAATCTLALAGAASVATYQNALGLVTYRNTSDAPSTAARVARFTVDDGQAANNTGSADRDLTVTAADDSPVAVSDAQTVAEDASATAVPVLTNDTDVDGGSMTVASVTQPLNGTVAITGSGTGVTYAPTANYCNSASAPSINVPVLDTFTYTLSPGSSTATVSMTVTCVNDAPVVTTTSGAATYTENDAALALDPEIGVEDGDAVSLASATVQLTTGCADPEDVLELASPPTGITVTGYTAATCTLALTGAATVATYQDALRLVTYRNTSDTPATTARVARFTVNDGEAASNTGSADRDLTVTAADDSPVAVNDAQTVAEDASATAVDVLTNDTDVDAGSKTVASVTQPAHGTVVITGSGTGVTYAPGTNYCNSAPPAISIDAPAGPDTFTYTLSPGGSTATVSMTVTCADDSPVAVDDSGVVNGDSVGNSMTVLANDTDVDGGTKVVASVTQPVHGVAAVGPSGLSVTYTPTTGYCNVGPNIPADSFTYTLNGGSSATVSVIVTCTCGVDRATDFVVGSNP